MREGEYLAYLYSVDIPKQLNGGSIDSIKSSYQDSLINIVWTYSKTQISFELTNNSDHTLKLIWDDAAFISIDNESSRIFHKGIKYIDRENPLPPTSLYKKTTLSDLIAPTSYIKYISGQYGGWQSSPLIPTYARALSNKVEYDENLIDRTMRVILPIMVGDSTFAYDFNFRTFFAEINK